MFKKIINHFVKRLSNEGGFLQFIPAIAKGGMAISQLVRNRRKTKNIRSLIQDFNSPEFEDDPNLAKFIKNLEGIELPEFKGSDDFREQQDFFQKFSRNLITGGTPKKLESLTQTGSKEFENFLGRTIADIQRSALETAALTGRGRGGAASAKTARQVADTTSNLRFQDFLRTQANKKFLFQEGSRLSEGVRNSAFADQTARNRFSLDIVNKALGRQGALIDTSLAKQSQKNNFNLKTSDLEFDKAKTLDQIELDSASKRGSALATLIGTLGKINIGKKKSKSVNTGGLSPEQLLLTAIHGAGGF